MLPGRQRDPAERAGRHLVAVDGHHPVDVGDVGQVGEVVLVGAAGRPRRRSRRSRTGCTTRASSSRDGCGVRSAATSAVEAERAVVRARRRSRRRRPAARCRPAGAARAPGRPSPTRSRPAGRGAARIAAQYRRGRRTELFMACDVLAHDQRPLGQRDRRRPLLQVARPRGTWAATTSVSRRGVRHDSGGVSPPESSPVEVAVLVVHRARGVVRPQPRGGGVEDRRPAALVAQRPHDDARVVLVAQRHAGDPLEDGRAPLGSTWCRRAQVGVRLEVRLVDDVHAELVAHVVEVGVVRVVRGAHRVEVVRLHQLDVAARSTARLTALPRPRVVVVAVDALDQHGPAVDQQLVAAHLDPAEADAQRHRVEQRAVGVDQLDPEVVQARVLRRPRLHRSDLGRDAWPRGR